MDSPQDRFELEDWSELDVGYVNTKKETTKNLIFPILILVLTFVFFPFFPLQIVPIVFVIFLYIIVKEKSTSYKSILLSIIMISSLGLILGISGVDIASKLTISNVNQRIFDYLSQPSCEGIELLYHDKNSCYSDNLMKINMSSLLVVNELDFQIMGEKDILMLRKFIKLEPNITKQIKIGYNISQYGIPTKVIVFAYVVDEDNPTKESLKCYNSEVSFEVVKKCLNASFNQGDLN